MNAVCGAGETRRRILHAGCGHEALPEFFVGCEEIRLDADASTAPDIVGSMSELGEIGQFDGVWCSHALEHLHPVEAMKALAEFRRVLKPGGFASIIVPDLEGISPTFDLLPGAAVCGHDLIYGMTDTLSNPWMFHRTGFVEKTLRGALDRAGFSRIVTQRLSGYNLMGTGVK